MNDRAALHGREGTRGGDRPPRVVFHGAFDRRGPRRERAPGVEKRGTGRYAADMTSWHYAVGERSTGPVEEKTLRALIEAGAVNGDTLVWREGMTTWAPARDVPEVASLLASGPTPPRSPHAIQPQVAGADGPIASRNPKALTSFSLGFCSLVPCVGALLGLCSIVFGIAALQDRARNPRIDGAAHAWIGIVLGTLSVLAHIVLAVVVLTYDGFGG